MNEWEKAEEGRDWEGGRQALDTFLGCCIARIGVACSSSLRPQSWRLDRVPSRVRKHKKLRGVWDDKIRNREHSVSIIIN